jgi:hypothetical protein
MNWKKFADKAAIVSSGTYQELSGENPADRT